MKTQPRKRKPLLFVAGLSSLSLSRGRPPSFQFLGSAPVVTQVGTTSIINGAGCSFTTPSGLTGIPGTDVVQHKTASDCWAVLQDPSATDLVWDLSGYANRHGGGATSITNVCGADATSSFQRQHQNGYLAQLQVGPPSPPNVLMALLSLLVWLTQQMRHGFSAELGQGLEWLKSKVWQHVRICPAAAPQKQVHLKTLLNGVNHSETALDDFVATPLQACIPENKPDSPSICGLSSPRICAKQTAGEDGHRAFHCCAI